MNDANALLDIYRKSKTISDLRYYLQNEGKHINLKDAKGSSSAFILAALTEELPSTYVIVCFDKEEAAFLYNDIKEILQKSVYFLPDSFKIPGKFQVLRNNHIQERIEVLSKLENNDPIIIVTYPESIFETVTKPEDIGKDKIEIEKGKDLDMSFLSEMLFDYGFVKEEFVYEPGQFSIRGGIIDIFSYGGEWPYRIELFDEEVESIRTFNPLTQLSLRNIAKVNLLPNSIGNENHEKCSFPSILPSNTILVTTDFSSINEKQENILEKINQVCDLLDDDNEVRQFLKSGYIHESISEELSKFSIISIDKSLSKVLKPIEISHNSIPQPAFNKNIKLLIENLQKNTQNGINNYIFSENKKQIERLYAIFEDLEVDVSWVPVYFSIHKGFIDKELSIALYTDHEIFRRFHKYKLRKGFSKDMAMNLKMLREMVPGDFITHIDHGIGKFSGLETITVNGRSQDSIRIFYKNNDLLYVSVNALHKISKFTAKDGKTPSLNKLGSDAWTNLKRKTKAKIKDIAKDLILLYAKRKATKGYSYDPDGYLQHELEASFMFEDTPDQLKTTIEVKNDMESDQPMDRLVCGDVGFGKTEIAIRATFKAVINGKQVAILVPTTILALQHFRSFNERLESMGVSVDYINRFRTAKQKKDIIARLKEGKLDVVIGTHGILSKDMGFKDLGLLIIDEEQKFGVAAKEKLRNLKVNVDTLTLTATPIPRTLQFSLLAARDMSVMRTAPPNRQSIHTENITFKPEFIRDAINYELDRGGQVFFVHNRVKSLPEMFSMIRRLNPDAKIVMAHGQMESKALEKNLLDFIEGDYDVMVSTNIIETGLDIPNANTIIISNAHHFGMSDLHQLRGRVGRSNRKAYCYLMSPPVTTLTADARKRLKALEDFSDLGSGFNIAMRDLDIRGAGNLLGAEQSGFIADIGFETFQKILDEAIRELKEKEFKDLFSGEEISVSDYVRDVVVETDADMLIPDTYVSSIQERLSLYSQLSNITDEIAISEFANVLEDRFGRLPKSINELFDSIRVQWICKKLGFERIHVKNNTMKAYFILDPQSPYYETPIFQNILLEVHKTGEEKGISFKKSIKYFIMIVENIPSLSKAIDVLIELEETIKG